MQVRDPTWKLPGEIRPEKMPLSSAVLQQIVSCLRTGSAYLSGWGWTSKRSRMSDGLMVANVPIVGHENFNELYDHLITENMVCAGGSRADACRGDSGGPLTCERNRAPGNKERYLCGIVSWGSPDCRRMSMPSVYTDVSKYSSWIEKFLRTWERHYWSKVNFL